MDGSSAETLGGVAAVDSDLFWTRTTSNTSDATGNSDSDGTIAACIGGGSTAELDVVDFGSSGSRDDNVSWDLQVDSGQVYVAGDDASFGCDETITTL